MSDGQATGKAQDALIDQEIFYRDLNEVHLLIEFISSLPGKSLNDLKLPDPSWDAAPNPAAVKRRIMDQAESVARISKIRFPPQPDPKTRAEDAAVLLLAKDRLNELARPARGRSVAYTTMFVSGVRKQKGDQHTETPQDLPRWGLAQRACPELVSDVRRFRAIFLFLLIFVFVWLLVTAICYWDAALGDSILQNFNAMDQEKGKFYQANPKLLGCSPSSDVYDTSASSGDYDAATRLSCLKLNQLSANQQKTVEALARFSSCIGWPYYWSPRCWPGLVFGGRQTVGGTGRGTTDVAPAQQGGTEPEKQSALAGQRATALSGKAGTGIGQQLIPPDTPTIAANLLVYGTYILPMMFGVLGTLVAALRAVHDKIRDNLLAPRDLLLTLTSLPIGAVAGLAVGLFFRYQAGLASELSGLPSAASLSAAGLAFLAGYAADAFFSFLNSVRSQVFKATNPPPGSDAAAYRTERVRASASQAP